jgi:hypothetical protein
MPYRSTWTNSDGLVVGFGPKAPEFAGELTDEAGTKLAVTTFDWKDLNAASAINVPVPAGAAVLDVRLVVLEGFTATGTNTITVGDGSTANGFITVSAATSATMANAGAVILSDGVYAFATTDTTAPEIKRYTSADTIDLASAQTDWLGGKAALRVVYM